MRREMANERRIVRSVGYRGAVEADVEQEHAVFVAAEGDLLSRHGFGWAQPPPFARVAPELRHLLVTDPERCFVAEADGRVVGYSAVIVREGWAFLAALFIAPAFQGIGVGKQLFDLAFEGAPAQRMTISDAIQPVSNALYARNGLLPTTPVLGFRGEPTTAMPSVLVAAEPTDAALSMLDRAAYGFGRSVDHSYWAAIASPTLWLRDGEPVAYSYRRSTGRVGPLAGIDEASAGEALWAELAGGSSSSLEIPGTSRSLVRVALEGGLRLTAPPGLLLLSDGVEPPRSIAIASYGLM